jgi:hypothetical protein
LSKKKYFVFYKTRQLSTNFATVNVEILPWKKCVVVV